MKFGDIRLVWIVKHRYIEGGYCCSCHRLNLEDFTENNLIFNIFVSVLYIILSKSLHSRIKWSCTAKNMLTLLEHLFYYTHIYLYYIVIQYNIHVFTRYLCSHRL